MTEREAAALDVCPFCGGEALLVARDYTDDQANFGNAYVYCLKCGVEQPWRLTKADATAAWNRRLVRENAQPPAEPDTQISVWNGVLRAKTGVGGTRGPLDPENSVPEAPSADQDTLDTRAVIGTWNGSPNMHTGEYNDDEDFLAAKAVLATIKARVRDEEREAYLASEIETPAGKLLTRIAERYQADPVNVARAFDEVIDRSGNSLGWLRDITRQPLERGEHRNTHP